VFVHDKLFQLSLTNTNLVRKLANYGEKKYYNIGPRRERERETKAEVGKRERETERDKDAQTEGQRD
jgi:hypothetical protein